MTNDGKKLEPPFRLDIEFGEALSRFAATKPKEVAESIERSKTKKPPQEDSPRRPGRSADHLTKAATRLPRKRS
jgi:hypothetical protein